LKCLPFNKRGVKLFLPFFSKEFWQWFFTAVFLWRKDSFIKVLFNILNGHLIRLISMFYMVILPKYTKCNIFVKILWCEWYSFSSILGLANHIRG
jgi:hypothetical protein